MLFSTKWLIHLKRNFLGALRSCSCFTIYNFQSYNSDYIHPFGVKSVRFSFKKNLLKDSCIEDWAGRRLATCTSVCSMVPSVLAGKEQTDMSVTEQILVYVNYGSFLFPQSYWVNSDSHSYQLANSDKQNWKQIQVSKLKRIHTAKVQFYFYFIYLLIWGRDSIPI